MSRWPAALDQEIAWWKARAFESDSDAALIAFGVATGLKLAKHEILNQFRPATVPDDGACRVD